MSLKRARDEDDLSGHQKSSTPVKSEGVDGGGASAATSLLNRAAGLLKHSSLRIGSAAPSSAVASSSTPPPPPPPPATSSSRSLTSLLLSSSSSPTPIASSSLEEEAAPLPPLALLTLPREMRAVAHQLHSLDRQCRAAVCEVTKLTELFLMVSACSVPTQMPKALLLQFPPTSNGNIQDMLACVEANIRNSEVTALRLAAEKRHVAERLVKLVDDRTRAATSFASSSAAGGGKAGQ